MTDSSGAFGQEPGVLASSVEMDGVCLPAGKAPIKTAYNRAVALEDARELRGLVKLLGEYQYGRYPRILEPFRQLSVALEAVMKRADENEAVHITTPFYDKDHGSPEQQDAIRASRSSFDVKPPAPWRLFEEKEATLFFEGVYRVKSTLQTEPELLSEEQKEGLDTVIETVGRLYRPELHKEAAEFIKLINRNMLGEYALGGDIAQMNKNETQKLEIQKDHNGEHSVTVDQLSEFEGLSSSLSKAAFPNKTRGIDVIRTMLQDMHDVAKQATGNTLPADTLLTPEQGYLFLSALHEIRMQNIASPNRLTDEQRTTLSVAIDRIATTFRPELQKEMKDFSKAITKEKLSEFAIGEISPSHANAVERRRDLVRENGAER